MTERQAPPKDLEPSELGTKEYWDTLYARELANHAHDPGDEGTVWFDDSDAESRTLDLLAGLLPERSSPSFLDLGTGNGSFLLALRRESWTGEMLGVDYSATSVALARGVQRSRRGAGGDGLWPEIGFRTHDLLGPSSSSHPGPLRQDGRPWDVLHDKGTFDAISLSSSLDAATGRRVAGTYRSRILPLLKPGGRFVVTSCNWTEAELRAWFEGDAGSEGGAAAAADEDDDFFFKYEARVEYPSFSFGGGKGQTISTLCFRKETRLEEEVEEE